MMILRGPHVVAALLCFAFLSSTAAIALGGAFTPFTGSPSDQIGSSLPASLQLFGELSQTRIPQPKTLVLLGAGLIGVFWLTWLRRRRS